MDTKFTTIWKVIGWENVSPVDEQASHILTIQFICSLKEVEGGITFYLFEKEYYLTWKNLSSHLGFNTKCSIDLDYSLRGFNHHEYWRVILGQNVVSKFQPHNMNIPHPTLRFMHQWIAMTLFSRQDICFVYHAKIQLFYAMLKKTKVTPMKEMFNHWLETIKASTTITCTSLVTRIAASIGALDGQDVTYISTSRIQIDKHFLMQGHHLKHDDAGNLVFYFLGYTNEIPLPNPGFSLYKSPSLTFTPVEQEEACRISVSRKSTRSRARDEAGSSQ
jgi:hypothetical protein